MEHAESQDLLEKPAFAWRAKTVLKKRHRVTSKVKSKHWERTTKYDICIPKTIDESKRIDSENSNTLWMDAVKKEMMDIVIACEEHTGDPAISLIGFQEITGHVVFDVS